MNRLCRAKGNSVGSCTRQRHVATSIVWSFPDKQKVPKLFPQSEHFTLTVIPISSRGRILRRHTMGYSPDHPPGYISGLPRRSSHTPRTSWVCPSIGLLKLAWLPPHIKNKIRSFRNFLDSSMSFSVPFDLPSQKAMTISTEDMIMASR